MMPDDVWYDIIGGGVPGHARFRVVKAPRSGGLLLKARDAVIECECGAQMPPPDHAAHVQAAQADQSAPRDSHGHAL